MLSQSILELNVRKFNDLVQNMLLDNKTGGVVKYVGTEHMIYDCFMSDSNVFLFFHKVSTSVWNKISETHEIPCNVGDKFIKLL
jgi:hypothetical protein